MAAYKVAIVGAGPAGYFAAQALQNLANDEQTFSIDMIERLPTPWGLVRSGVAPDHPKIKTVSKVFEKIATAENFRLFANVEVGSDITVAQLQEKYDAVIIATGSSIGKKLGDVARMLALEPTELDPTDTADHAIDAFKHSNIRKVYISARRGPEHAAFTSPELRELPKLEHTNVVIRKEDIETAIARAGAEPEKDVKSNLDAMLLIAENPKSEHERTMEFLFQHTPKEILGTDRVEGVVYSTPNGDVTIKCVIGTNKSDAAAVIEHLVSDLQSPKNKGDISELITHQVVVTQELWQKINEAEVAAGEPKGKPRVKSVKRTELLKHAGL